MASIEKNHKDTQSLHDNQLFSDAKIKFSGQTFHGHKAILCQKSKYFMKAFTSGFEEARTGIIDLGTDDDPDCVRSMLRHIYDLPLAITGKPSKLVKLHVDLFLMGDKYDVPSLRLLCTNLLEDTQFSNNDFKSALFFDALRRCFSSVQADKSMKKRLIVKITPSLGVIWKEPGFVDVLGEAPDLPKKLLLTILGFHKIRSQLRTLPIKDLAAITGSGS